MLPEGKVSTVYLIRHNFRNILLYLTKVQRRKICEGLMLLKREKLCEWNAQMAKLLVNERIVE